MGLEKLTITPEKGSSISALFNPEKYTASRGVQYAEIAIPGLDAPVVQFIRGQSEKVTLELFFDTTDQGTIDPVTDVRTLTSQVYGLMRVQSDTHAPPRLIVAWGDGGKLFNYGGMTSPWCVLESVSQEFTLFSPAGGPAASEAERLVPGRLDNRRTAPGDTPVQQQRHKVCASQTGADSQ